MPKLIKDAWRRIGASDRVLQWIDEGVPLEFSQEPAACFLQNRISGDNQVRFVNEEVNRLLNINAIREVSRNEVHCVLPLRCVPKKQNKNRLVLDCRHVNENIVCPTFTQEGLQSVQDQIQEHDKLISIDLENGFHHVEIKKEFQKYLGFQWSGRFYVWTVLAFGIKSAPYFFYKILRPVVTFFRQNGIRNALFVDDFLIMMKDMYVTDHTEFVLNTLQELGWHVNWSKSVLTPDTSCEFIGYVVASEGPEGPWVKVTQKKMHKLRRHINQALKYKKVHARFLAKIGGECIAMMKAVLPAKLLLRNLYRTLSSRTSWNSEVIIDEHCAKDLQWWLDALKNWNGSPLLKKEIEVQVETDASGTGWGGICHAKNLQASGTWTKDVSMQPSNYRELLAILKCIQSFRKDLRNVSLQILSDNVTSVAYVNKFGGTSRRMSELMTTIFVTTQELGISLSAKYLKGKINIFADGLSRILSPYEWQLHPQVFVMLDRMWGPHTIDRFASEMTSQLVRYNSLYSDPNTEAVDALAQKWTMENNFINAPFWMLNKVINKVIQDQAVATVIAPRWPAQIWYAKLRKLSISAPVKIPNVPRVMLKRSGIPEPLKNRKWSIYAWRISGRIS